MKVETLPLSSREWTRLSRDEEWAILDRLGATPKAVTFSRDLTVVQSLSLPFYAGYRPYRLITYATMPVFTRTYLSDGVDFIALDGTVAPIYAANKRATLRLTEGTVVPYLSFVLASLRGAAGAVQLIEDLRQIGAPEGLSLEQQHALAASITAPGVRGDDARGRLDVKGTLHYGRSLYAATMALAPGGRLTFVDHKLLLSGFDLPHYDAEPPSRQERDTEGASLDALFEPSHPLPPEAAIVAKGLEILNHSPHGQKLAALAKRERIEIRIIATPSTVTYLPVAGKVYIGFSPNRPWSPAVFVLLLVRALREAQQELDGLKLLPLSAPSEEQTKVGMAKYEDCLWYICTVALELAEQEAFADFRFREELATVVGSQIVALFVNQETRFGQV